MEALHLTVSEEIALEGLDGITLDTLWLRLSERLKFPLPLNRNFQIQIWKLIQTRSCFEFYEIGCERPTVKIMDRRDYYFNKDILGEEIEELMKSTYYIYSYHPVDHSEIRGSCKEFLTRNKLDTILIKSSTLDEVEQKYHSKFIVVASQTMRNSVLIPKNIGRECDINEQVYCILERIGRARYFGEATSGPFSLNDFVKDSKLLHYFRNTLIKNQLVVRQHLQLKVRGNRLAGQLFHLPRFHIVVRADMILTEKLFEFLVNKPGQIAEMSKIRTHLKSSHKAVIALIKSRKNVFNYNAKCLYRECYPEASEDKYVQKNKAEKTIATINLIDPNLDILKLWNIEDDDLQGEDKGFLDISNQQFNRPLIHQVCQKIAEAGREGMSQHELGKYFGLSKLNARSVLRKIQKQRNISFYMKDEGRQRVSKYVTKDAAHDASKEFIAEMKKLLKKSDEASNSAAILNVETNDELSLTKVSIPLSPTTLKMLKPVEDSDQYSKPSEIPQETEEDEPLRDHIFQTPNSKAISRDDFKLTPVIVPDEDSSFIDNVENVAVSMRFLNCIPKIKKQAKGIAKAVAQSRISQKVVTRMNAILDIIKNKTVIDSMNLLNLMRQTEEDLPEMICRKSMLTLCGKLAADNFLKIVEMELKSETKVVTLVFFVATNVSFDMKCWHSIIEEQKIQHFIPTHRQTKSNFSDVSKVLAMPKPSASCESNKPNSSIATEEFGPESKTYENFPKFMKMKLFHEFLFYLIYAFPVDHKKIPIQKALDTWGKDNPKIFDYESITENITNCYSTEISWKMFVSPLHQQGDYKTGWGLLRDIIHRIPLILFVKFFRFAQEIALLQEYLAHPIKSNYLLHFLPEKLRKQLLQGRKHVFVIQDLCKKLCWCGLLQFGPTRTKEIDQSFVYLNRNASLLDTRSSAEGYLEISDQEYPEIKFYFNSSDQVTSYWNKMYQIALNTKINKKSTANGKTVEIEQIAAKLELQANLVAQTPTSAPLKDNGTIPGDHKGAAGLDKAFLVHLRRNWTRPLEGSKRRQFRAISTSSILGEDVTVKHKKTKVKKDKPSTAKEIAAKIKTKSISAAQSRFKPKPAINLKSKTVQKNNAINLIKQRALMAQDAVDKEALKMMKTMRVTWSEPEDRTLLLIKVALKFAFPQEAQSAHYASPSVVRDILHWRTDKAINKTSKACTRRIQYLMKTKVTFKEQIALYVEELKTNREFIMKYRNLADRLKKVYPLVELYNAVKIHIVEMVHRLHQIFYKQYQSSKIDANEIISYRLPDDYAELIQKYKITNPVNTLTNQKYLDPSSPNESEISVLMSLIHSALCCSTEKTSYSYHLFEIYKKFSDANLSLAVSSLKRANVISINKKDKNKDKSILPYSFSPFHLSTRYASQMMSVHVTVDLYNEYFKAVRAVSESNGSYQMKSLNCGWIFFLAEMMSSGKVFLSYEKAEKLVMVDPALRSKSNFDKISDNYLRLMNRENTDGVKEKKTVKFPTDDNHDTFLYSDDPIEIFFKTNQLYSHTFCILETLAEDEDEIEINSWTISEDGNCTASHCIVNDENFDEQIRKISSEKAPLLKELLNNTSTVCPQQKEMKQSFITFLGDFIQKHETTFEENTRKDLCGKVMARRNLLTVDGLVGAILRLGIEPGLEEDSWLSEYKKISRNTDEEVLDDEDLESTADQIKHSKMFHQLKDLNLSSRTSDSFVVNLSTIFVDVKDGPGNKITFEGCDFDHLLISFKEEDRAGFFDQILSEAKFNQDDLNINDLFEELTAIGITSTLDIMQISEVCTFVQSKAKMGAAPDELLKQFGDKTKLHTHIKVLIKMKFLLKVGVVEMKFVHKDFATFWLIDTFYMTREGPTAQVASPNEGRLKRKISETGSVDNPEKKLKAQNDDLPSTSISLLVVEDSVKKLPEVNKPPLVQKAIRIRLSPWIRVNGTLNRRVLDKWLGTILNHLTINPSMMFSDLCSKFNILTPFDMRWLCEILEMIGSAQLMSVVEPEIDLFSTYTSPVVEPATYFCPSEQIFIELKDGAMQRLSFFIGRQKYKTPFV